MIRNTRTPKIGRTQHHCAEVRAGYLLNGKLNRSHIHVDFRCCNCVYMLVDISLDVWCWCCRISKANTTSASVVKKEREKKGNQQIEAALFSHIFWIWNLVFFSRLMRALFALCAIYNDVGSNNRYYYKLIHFGRLMWRMAKSAKVVAESNAH